MQKQKLKLGYNGKALKGDKSSFGIHKEKEKYLKKNNIFIVFDDSQLLFTDEIKEDLQLNKPRGYLFKETNYNIND